LGDQYHFHAYFNYVHPWTSDTSEAETVYR
jgi:hypothetical protein